MAVAAADEAAAAAGAAVIAAIAVTAGKQAFRNRVRSAPADSGRFTPLNKFKAAVLRPSRFPESLTFPQMGRPMPLSAENREIEAPRSDFVLADIAMDLMERKCQVQGALPASSFADRLAKQFAP
jgi:hypothetical protein